MARGDRGGREECLTSAGLCVGHGGDDSSCEDAGTVMRNLEVMRRINDGFMSGGGLVVGGDGSWILVFVFDLRKPTSFSVVSTDCSRTLDFSFTTSS